MKKLPFSNSRKCEVKKIPNGKKISHKLIFYDIAVYKKVSEVKESIYSKKTTEQDSSPLK